MNMSYCLANISLLVALLLLSSTAATSTSAFFTGLSNNRHLLKSVCDEGQVLIGTECTYCPPGQVKHPAGKNNNGVCEAAAIHCGVGQCGKKGVCENCPNGMMPNAGRKYCVQCTRGAVKRPSAVSPAGVCVTGSKTCYQGQWIRNGVCTNCPSGHVPKEDRSGCEFCAAGFVKFPAGNSQNSVCKKASKVCDVGQIGSNGVCTNCGDNMVPNVGRTSCESCPAGTIKDPPGTNSNGVCIQLVIVTCDIGQWNNAGVCTNCGTGQVPNTAGTGCVDCPVGQVKDPPGTNSNGTCVTASSKCLVGQIGSGGVCVDCIGNQVPNAGRTSCVDCDAGEVKNPPGTNSAGVCVAAGTVCLPGQIGSGGVCVNCTGNLVPDAGRATCVNCPAGKVKIPPGTGSTGVCVAADTVCGLNQIGSGGVCETCTGKLVPDANRINCVDCPDGTVKSPAGTNSAAVCVAANTVCAAGQIGSGGICVDCTAGKVPNAGRTSCEYCAAGKVKNPPGTNSDGVCVYAECVCTSSQVGVAGVCTDCDVSALPNEDRTSCVECTGFIENGVCKAAECAGIVYL